MRRGIPLSCPPILGCIPHDEQCSLPHVRSSIWHLRRNLHLHLSTLLSLLPYFNNNPVLGHHEDLRMGCCIKPYSVWNNLAALDGRNENFHVCWKGKENNVVGRSISETQVLYLKYRWKKGRHIFKIKIIVFNLPPSLTNFHVYDEIVHKHQLFHSILSFEMTEVIGEEHAHIRIHNMLPVKSVFG